jgi:hypothetical protein
VAAFVFVFGETIRGPVGRSLATSKELEIRESQGRKMGTQALLVEVLISAFFAVACFRSRAESPTASGLAPQRLFILTDRLERLRRSRWQWFSMVLLLVVVRMQQSTPIVAEVTALAQFIVFLALPSHKTASEGLLKQ